MSWLEGMDVNQESEGDFFVAGRFTNGPNTFFGTPLTSVLYNDGFVSRVSSQGTGLWTVHLKSKMGDIPADVAVDNKASAAGNRGVFVGGGTNGNPATFGHIGGITSGTGNYDNFVAKVSKEGTALWAVLGGGVGYDYVNVCSGRCSTIFFYMLSFYTRGSPLGIMAKPALCINHTCSLFFLFFF